MTEYHPITEEELEWICNDHCNSDCKNCEFVDGIFCQCEGVDELNKRILTRPDPLALLEAWREHEKNRTCTNALDFCDLYFDESQFIASLRTNPEAVRQQGIKEGWWKE